MHRSLLIHEILVNITSSLTERSDWLAMAKTCVAFQEPAISFVWRNLHDLKPLAGLLTKKSMDSSAALAEGQSPSSQVITREAEAEWDWSRWRAYENHVKEIRCVEIGDIDTKVLECGKLDNLLPNLRGATIVSRSLRSLTYLLPLTLIVSGPKLRSLTYIANHNIHSEEGGVLIDNLFAYLLTQTLPITTFNMRRLQQAACNARTLSSTIHTRNTMVQFIRTLHNIRHLTIYNIFDLPFTLLLEVAKLPHLRVLNTQGWGTNDTPVVLPAQSFPALAELNIKTHAVLWREFESLLVPPASHLRALSLRYIWNDSIDDDSVPDLPPSLQNLASLEVLDINLHDQYAHTSPWCNQEPRFYSTLVSLGNLRIVSITFTKLRGPSRELIRKFALGWPKLESLTLASFSRTRSRYSAEDLLPFVNHCPHLTTLRIPVFHTPVPTLNQTNTIPAPQMERAIFHGSRLNPEGVDHATSFVRQYWPNANVEFQKDDNSLVRFIDSDDSDGRDDTEDIDSNSHATVEVDGDDPLTPMD